MTTDTPSAEALANMLAAHNRWRRGDDEPAPDPTELGKTIDAAAAALRSTMRQTHEWPGHWTRVAPRVEDHPEGAELAWIARGYPFTRPVLARSNVGVKRAPTWVVMEPKYEQFVRVELMADSFHGRDASAYGWFRDLEWLGPLVLPNGQSQPARARAEREPMNATDDTNAADRGSELSERLGPVVPKRDRATSEPGGCECDECGAIFIGGPEHNLCAVCEELFDKYGNPLDGSSLPNCCFPDCGCDGSRNCMAESGANFAGCALNYERGTKFGA